ncbi:MAG: hypothetical protein MJ093_09265 [Saccharofermentans sp.]|nr:hypothetical protein [Saccharofermentans sp.]
MKSNKGMAFVSVVIAILFIGLLATSLAFMSYNNYQTKATRWASENNFYYDELAINELTSVMRQNALELGDAEYLTDPSTKDKLTCFITSLGVITGTGDTGDYKSSFTGTWDPAKMQALVPVTNNSNIEVVVSVSSRGPNTYIRDRKNIKYKNVQFTVTDKSVNYTTTITTDIEIPGKTISASVPVNDFSLMTDNAFIWNKGGVVQVSGNFFCIDNPSSPTHNGIALQISNGTQMHLDGNKSLIVGDVLVETGSVLYLNNEVTITGKITTQGTGRVQIGGNAVYMAEVDSMGTGNVIGEKHVLPELRGNANSVFNGSGTYGKGLASAIMDNVGIITGFDASTNTPTARDYLTAYNDNVGGSNHAIGNRSTNRVEQNSASGTSKIYFYGTTGDDLSGSTQYDNSLIFLPNQTVVRGQILGSTIIAPNGNKVNHTGDALTAPNWSKLSNEKYRDCLNTMVTNINVSGYNNPVNMTKAQFDSIINYYKANKNNVELMNAYPYYVEEMNGYANLGNGDRYIVYKKDSNQCAYPWGYFIREDANDIIGDAFAQIRDKNDEGGEYKIVYQNWVKE